MSGAAAPMNGSTLLERYRAMHGLTEHMLEAARAAQWDQLVQLEQSRSTLEAELRQAPAAPSSAAQRAETVRLITAILAADAQIGVLASAAKAELQAALARIGMTSKVNQAYNLA
jgi:flagellar protein FliT